MTTDAPPDPRPFPSDGDPAASGRVPGASEGDHGRRDALSPEQRQAVDDEIAVLDDVLRRLRAEAAELSARAGAGSDRARTLTAEVVATRRAEDKALLVSDESVAHAVTARSLEGLERTKRMADSPYFARVELDEDTGDGRVRRVEFKLGLEADPACRIVDWRRAPIAKLYYHYREGEEYSEEILGRERSGTVVLRNAVDVGGGRLVGVTCRHGRLVLAGDRWEARSGGDRGRPPEGHVGLPPVLAFVTPEQWAAITTDASSAVLVRGSAGSGKTTVALYRLAWLMAAEGRPPGDPLVLVRSNPLAFYVRASLPSAGLAGVAVETFDDWLRKSLPGAPPRAVDPCPPAAARVKSSYSFLAAVEAAVRDDPARAASPDDTILALLSRPEGLASRRDGRPVDPSLVAAARGRTAALVAAGRRDAVDDVLALRMRQIAGSAGPRRSHVVIDEVQDFSPAELAVAAGAAASKRHLTVAGDAAQEIGRGGTPFPGWQGLLLHWGLESESEARHLTLTVSHRSTGPIMRLADHVLGERRSPKGRPGPLPVRFDCRSEEGGVRAAIDWISETFARDPSSRTAVLCGDRTEAAHVHRLLAPSLGEALRLGTDGSFPLDAGVLVTEVRLTKGLEFRNVLLWNPSASRYGSSDPLHRRLLYVAVTRAEDTLAAVTWGRPSPLLPGRGSPVMRIHEEEEEDEEEDTGP